MSNSIWKLFFLVELQKQTCSMIIIDIVINQLLKK